MILSSQQMKISTSSSKKVLICHDNESSLSPFSPQRSWVRVQTLKKEVAVLVKDLLRKKTAMVWVFYALMLMIDL